MNNDAYSTDRPTLATRVLVTGAGGPAAVSVMRTIGSTAVDLFAADIDAHAVGLYLVPEERRLLLPRGDDPAFARTVADLCEELAIDVLIPTVDSELLPIARISHEIEARGTRIVLAREETLEICLDKLLLARHCEGAVPVPRSEVLAEDTCLDEWTFPLIAKPRSGSGGRGVRVVGAPAELADLPKDGSYLLQQYLPGEEYSVDVFADLDGTVRASVPRIRLKVDSGIAVASRTVRDGELEALGRRVAEEIGLRYVANIQFRRDESGVPHLLEVNPRFPGTMPLTVAAGVDMPNMALQGALGFEAWADDIVFGEIAVVRHWQEVFIDATAFEDVRSRVRSPEEAGACA